MVLISLCLALAHAASAGGPKVLKLPIVREERKASSVSKRETYELDLANLGIYYSTNITLGSQGTAVKVDVDTGSSDLWIGNTAYDSSSSSTWKDLNIPFVAAYGDGTLAFGSFGTDTVGIAGAKVSSAQFALADFFTSRTFVFGIGFNTGESTAYDNTTDNTITGTYNNVPTLLKSQGYTESNSYSIWLDQWSASEGNVLFGGVDHSKYEGVLAKVPIIADSEPLSQTESFRPNIPNRLVISLNSIGVTNEKGESGAVISDANIPVLLDSGSTICSLPGDWVDAIANATGAVYDTQYGLYTIQNKSGSMDFSFSGVEIKVPFASFLRPIQLINGSFLTDGDGNVKYRLGAAPGSSGPGVHLNNTIYILGDSFLSGAYVAYDLDKYEIGLAPAKTDASAADDEDLEEIGAGGIPGTQAPSYSATSSNTEYSLHFPTGLF